MQDDLTEIAVSLDSHPMVVYPEDRTPHSLNFTETVSRCWARVSGSSVFLEEDGVYLTVTRVYFYKTFFNTPVISFLRGQVFDRSWNHLKNHSLTRQNRTIQFPTIFDVPIEYEEGGDLYGAEDPRIIIESGVPDADPVIVFNMKTSKSDWTRAMWIFRPFSGHAALLTIRGERRLDLEKNWVPILFRSKASSSGTAQSMASQHIHFLYSFQPLRVLYCELTTGDCDWAFWQHVPPLLKSEHDNKGAFLRGGTNFVEIPLGSLNVIDHAPDTAAFIGFPRTHIDGICADAIYRPMLAVLVTIAGQWFTAFASSSLDFGDAVLTSEQHERPCDEGRIMLPNSIASWDHSGEFDVMTITFSVGDKTVQVARAAGIAAVIASALQFQELLRGDLAQMGESFLLSMQHSAVGRDVEQCAIEAALNYTHHVKYPELTEEELQLRIQKDNEWRAKEEEERKAWEEAEKA